MTEIKDKLKKMLEKYEDEAAATADPRFEGKCSCIWEILSFINKLENKPKTNAELLAQAQREEKDIKINNKLYEYINRMKTWEQGNMNYLKFGVQDLNAIGEIEILD